VAQHTAEWTNWCYLENGKWAGDNEYGNHIVEIIDTAPVIRPDTKGYKEATGKIPMQYLPLDLLEGVADILATNCKDNGGKYERDNYRRPIDPTLLIGSLLRHLTQIQTAIRTDDGTYLIDSESKRAHVDHLISNTIMLKAALDNWEDER
jgi:hypothetical protein